MSIDAAHRRIRFWLETPQGAIAATWFQPPAGMLCRTALVVVPGIAHEDRTTSTGLAAIAEVFAEAGTPTLLFDLEGTAQSTGDLDTPEIVDRWPDDVRAAIAHVRASGFERVVLIGVRTGALLACVSLGDHPVDAIVLWSPVTSGRRYGRELRLLQSVSNPKAESNRAEATRQGAPTPAAGGAEIAGFTIPDALIRSLRTLEVSAITQAPAPHVLIIDSPDREHGAAIDHLRTLGTLVEEQIGPETDAWINRTTDGSSIPEGDIRAVFAWVQGISRAWTASPAQDLDTTGMSAVRDIDHRGTLIRETLVTVGSGALSAVWSEPLGGSRALADSPARILIAAVGPGRSFVEFARSQAVAGYSSLRFDLSGFGTSPRRAGRPWSEYYGTSGGAGVCAAIDAVVERGRSTVVLIGFCATAWTALLARDRREIVGVVAISVHLYVRDSPLSVLNGGSRNWLTRVIDRRLANNRCTILYHGLYRRLRLPAVPLQWTEELLRRGVRVSLMFDCQDDGLHFLLKRMPKHWDALVADGRLRLNTYPALGHSLDGPADRTRMLDDIGEQLLDLDAAATASVAH